MPSSLRVATMQVTRLNWVEQEEGVALHQLRIPVSLGLRGEETKRQEEQEEGVALHQLRILVFLGLRGQETKRQEE